MSATTDTAVRDFLRRRYRELTDTIDDVAAERDLTLYLAHRRGLSITDIGTIIGMDPARVDTTLDEFRRDEDAHTFTDGPRWVPIWPRQGWNPGTPASDRQEQHD